MSSNLFFILPGTPSFPVLAARDVKLFENVGVSNAVFENGEVRGVCEKVNPGVGRGWDIWPARTCKTENPCIARYVQ